MKVLEKVKHVFLIDDDEDDRLFFVEAMQELNASVHCSLAENGKKALQKLKEMTELPDIIFMDINMPELNGFECLKELKKCTVLQKIPVIMLSTSLSQQDINYSVELGAQMFFTKPSSYTKLCELLKQIFFSANS
ncbi:MAG TPA: response regulator [Bacteroidia bacterium]|jgi:CheY-like chemotaxis protein|nr:response regulator [Bacteroidia bacterium]